MKNLSYKKYLLYALLVILVACGSLPRDITPVWVQSNRHAVEQFVSCNSGAPSIGVSGCAFIGEVDDSVLYIPAMATSRLFFTSSKCGTTDYNGVGEFKTALKELYTNPTGTNCSFTISRFITLKKKKQLDFGMSGRFFIKIVPKNAHHALLKFGSSVHSFVGVGWYQRRAHTDPAKIYVHPSGQTGTFLMKCGEDTIHNFDYTEVPFEVTIPEGHDCDYEMSAINSDNPYIEFASFLYNEQEYTVDITTPTVSLKKDKITFTFTDKNEKGKPVVVLVRVNDKQCLGNECSVDAHFPQYEIRAITANSRYFKGIYKENVSAWEVIND